MSRLAAGMMGEMLRTTVSVMAEWLFVTKGSMGANWLTFQTRLPVAPGIDAGSAVTPLAPSLLAKV